MKIDLIIAGRRLRNRILDLVGRLLGYCMADTWQDETDDHGPRYAGYAHWRCWHTRRQHRNMHGPNSWHRFRSYRWRPGGTTEYHPLRTASGEVAGYGSPPAWARRFPHVMVPTRRRERLVTEYAERRAAARRAVQRGINATLARMDAIRARESGIVKAWSALCPHGVRFGDSAGCPDCPGGWQAAPLDDEARGRPMAPADDLMNLADAVAEPPLLSGPLCDGHCSGQWRDPDCSLHGTPRVPTQRKDTPQ